MGADFVINKRDRLPVFGGVYNHILSYLRVVREYRLSAVLRSTGVRGVRLLEAHGVLLFLTREGDD